MICENLGMKCKPADFTDDKLTPEWERYEDNRQKGTYVPNLEPTPEAGGQYLNVDISLPHCGSMAKGRVIGCKRDHEGNPIGHAADNPILDT